MVVFVVVVVVVAVVVEVVVVVVVVVVAVVVAVVAQDQFIKHLLYSLIEIYFRKNVSIKDLRLLKIQNYFLKKIANTKIFNLDDEAILIEFEEMVLNG